MVLSIPTTKTKEILDITDLVNEVVKKSGHENGLCVVFVKHTTACVTTADLDPGTDEDMLDAFEAIMPKLHYRHPHNPAHVTDHILSSMIGPSVIIPFKQKELDLGTWQRVVLIEVDGPRARKVDVSIIAG